MPHVTAIHPTSTLATFYCIFYDQCEAVHMSTILVLGHAVLQVVDHTMYQPYDTPH